MANLSGAHLNALEDRIVERLKAAEDALVKALVSDGPPYGSELLQGRELYDQLLEMRASGDPAYYSDPKAAEALAKLAELYGLPPAQQPPFSSPVQGVM